MPMGPVAPASGVLGLQRVAGNRAVDRLVAGRPLDGALRAEAETRFGEDFGDVRVHVGAEASTAARAVGAKAYTVGADIVFGAGQFQPASPRGRHLLAHELAHVVQQRRGGTAPALDPGAAHERDADRAAHAAVAGNGAVTVGAATGVGLSRAVDDWLATTPNIRDETQWSFTALLDEIDDIQQWFSTQTGSSPESVRLEEALAMLQAEVQRRQQRLGPQPKKRKPSQTRRRGRRRASEPEPTAEPEREMQRPRILEERTSVQYTDAAEIRQEIDLIVAWLKRDDITPGDREILQMELQNLAPGLQESRVQRQAERRASKIQQFLTPEVSGDARAMLLGTVKLIDTIRPYAEQPGYSYLMHGDEMILLQDEEVAAIRGGITAMMDSAAKKIGGVREDAFDKWAYQAKVDREEAFASWTVSLFTGTDAGEVADKMDPYLRQADNNLSRYHAMRRQGNLVEMAEALAAAEEGALKARLVANQWVEDVISTGENIVTGLTITRDLSFAIVGTYFGGAGFASLARSGVGLVRAGVTVAAIGTTATATARGGANLAGQALIGDVDYSQVGRETLAGAKQGLVNTTAGIVTAGTSSALGQGTTLAGRAVRGGLAGGAGGASGSGLEATLEGKSAGEVLEATAIGGGSGFVGGALGGVNAPGRLGWRGALTGSAADVAGGAASAYVEGGSIGDIGRAAGISLVTGRATAAASPGSRQQRGTPTIPGPGLEPGTPRPAETPPIAAEPTTAPPTRAAAPESGPEAAPSRTAAEERATPTRPAAEETPTRSPDADFDDVLKRLEGPEETGPFQGEGPLVRVPIHQEQGVATPGRALEVGAGPRNVDLGIPPSVEEHPASGAVSLRRTDITKRPGVSELDATGPVPPELVGQFDSIIINNPRGFVPNIAELGKALGPGGRIIVQGRGRVGPPKPKERGVNPDFQKLLDDPAPPGFRKIVDLEPTMTRTPGEIMGGPFSRTDMTTGVPGQGPRPNARIIFEPDVPTPASATGPRPTVPRSGAPPVAEPTPAPPARPAAAAKPKAPTARAKPSKKLTKEEDSHRETAETMIELHRRGSNVAEAQLPELIDQPDVQVTRRKVGKGEARRTERGKDVHLYHDPLDKWVNDRLKKLDPKVLGQLFPEGAPTFTNDPNFKVTDPKAGKSYRPDGVDWESGTIHEIKSDAEGQRELGQAKLDNVYKPLMDQVHPRPGGWKTKIWVYDRAVAEAILYGK
jgi:hypothetical protein